MIRTASPRRDSGFTLIELLIAITITGIVLVTITLTVSESLRHSTQTTDAVDRSRITNLTARYFGADVASSTGAQGNATPTNPPCGSGDSAIDIAVGDDTISYVVVDDGSRTSFVRRKCDGATTTAELTLGRTVDELAAVGACGYQQGMCTLTIEWDDPAQEFSVRGEMRVTSTTQP